MPEQSQAIINLPNYQRRAILNPAKFCWWNWSRQAGKSFGISLRCLLRGIRNNRRQIFMSAGERQSTELMDKVRQHIAALKLQCSQNSVIHKTIIKTLEIEIPGITKITAIPANPETARGFTGDIFLDEYAVHQKDREIWAAMLPSITRGRTGSIDVASTPKGPLNQFAKIAGLDIFHHDTVTIVDAVADGLDADIPTLRRLCNDDDLWNQEYMCQFIDGASVFLHIDMIKRCMVANDGAWGLNIERLSQAGDLYAGVDVGRRNDLTVIWIFSLTGTGSIRTVGIVVLERQPFSVQKDCLTQIFSLPNFRGAAIDETGIGMNLAEDMVERFGSHVVEPVYFTAQKRNWLGTGLRLAIEGQSVEIPYSDRIIEDFHSIQKDVTQAGTIQLSAPRNKNGHADLFWGAALGLSAIKTGQGGPIAIGASKQSLRNTG